MDILSETPIAISDAPSHIPGRPHVATIWRWRAHGIRGVKLETFAAGGRIFTTVEAIGRFLTRVTEVRNGEPVDRTPSRTRQAEIDKAEAELEAAGI